MNLYFFYQRRFIKRASKNPQSMHKWKCVAADNFIFSPNKTQIPVVSIWNLTLLSIIRLAAIFHPPPEAKIKRVFVYFMAKLFKTRRIDSDGRWRRRRRRRPGNFPAGLYRATLKTLPERFYQAKTNSVDEPRAGSNLKKCISEE